MKKIFTLLFFCSFLGMQAQEIITDTLMGVHDHTNDINMAVYSVDGRRLISGSSDRSVIVYESYNWIPMANYRHEREVSHVALSRDNSFCASLSKDNKVMIYSVDSAKVMFECEGVKGEVSGLEIDMAMRFVYISSDDGFIRIYDIRKQGFLAKEINVGIPVTSMALAHTGLIYAGLKTGDIKVYNNLGNEVKLLKATHKGSVTCLNYTFFRNKAWLISAGSDNLIKLWEPKTYKAMRSFSGHTWNINHIELSRDLRFIVSCANDGMVNIWDTDAGNLLKTIKVNDEPVKCASINEDNSNIAVTAYKREGTPEYILYIFDPKLPVKSATYKAPTKPKK